MVSIEEALVHQRPAEPRVVGEEPGDHHVDLLLVVAPTRFELVGDPFNTIRRFDRFAGISVRRPLRKNVRGTASSVGVTAPSGIPVSRGGPTCSASILALAGPRARMLAMARR